jgi:hypothetical protein
MEPKPRKVSIDGAYAARYRGRIKARVAVSTRETANASIIQQHK